jgi:ribosomal peptide maturation radical SAM protein 1
LRLALVNMPFATTRYPSIQLGLLQALAARCGIPATTYYLNLHFAQRIGWEFYEFLSYGHSYHVGEWIFAETAFEDCAPSAEPGLRAFLHELGWSESMASFLLRLRQRDASLFIDWCLQMPWDDYDVIGFSSIFAQNCAALALARVVKRRYPRLRIVFGGANFEDEMGLEYLRRLPWIDYVVVGEGDESFPALLDSLASGEELPNIPGVARRENGVVSLCGRAAPVRDLDSLPEPDYSDFFATAAELNLPETVLGYEIKLPFESARGCWWGAKYHCTFCGLNGLGMAYRSKSPARVLAEIDELARRHRRYNFEAMDNIMDQRYVREVFAPLAEQGKGYQFFYEVKANLTQEQLRTMSRGGVRALSPGIESVNSHLLKLMRKGTTGIQNVRLLKWAHHYGMKLGWNLLFGFPGERAEDYENQLATLKLIPHLPPPTAGGRIWLERFSPYFLDAQAWGLHNVRPDPAYASIYPSDLDHNRIAYVFQYDASDTLPPEMYEPTRKYAAWWQDIWRSQQRPQLRYFRGEGLTILDARQPDAPRDYVFDELAALTFEFCGPTHHTAAQILNHLREIGGTVDLGALQWQLETFRNLGLMLEEEGSYLSLALPTDPDV